MAEIFLLQCHHCHKILSQQPTKDEIGPEKLICPQCKAWVPTPYMTWKTAPFIRRFKLCAGMFIATAGGIYLVMLLMVLPVMQSFCQLFVLSDQFLHVPLHRDWMLYYFPLLSGLLATYMMRRNYIRGV